MITHAVGEIYITSCNGSTDLDYCNFEQRGVPQEEQISPAVSVDWGCCNVPRIQASPREADLSMRRPTLAVTTENLGITAITDFCSLTKELGD